MASELRGLAIGPRTLPSSPLPPYFLRHSLTVSLIFPKHVVDLPLGLQASALMGSSGCTSLPESCLQGASSGACLHLSFFILEIFKVSQHFPWSPYPLFPE